MKIVATSKKQEMDVFKAARSIKLQEYSINGLKALRQATAMVKQKDAVAMLQMVFDSLGYRSYLQHAHLSDDKLYILKQIARLAKDVPSFLQRLDQLAKIIREKKRDNDGKLVLSTIHSSKGLEYDRVILLDCVDGVLPSMPLSQIDPKNSIAVNLYQEERRLFYVAVTRSRNRLILFDLPDSSFIQEVRPEKQVQKLRASGTGDQLFVKKLRKGRKVIHEEFGEGVVLKKDDRTVTIRFEKVTKTFAIRFVCEQGLVHPV